jgi:hypothetical protein
VPNVDPFHHVKNLRKNNFMADFQKAAREDPGTRI